MFCLPNVKFNESFRYLHTFTKAAATVNELFGRVEFRYKLNIRLPDTRRMSASDRFSNESRPYHLLSATKSLLNRNVNDTANKHDTSTYEFNSNQWETFYRFIWTKRNICYELVFCIDLNVTTIHFAKSAVLSMYSFIVTHSSLSESCLNSINNCWEDVINMDGLYWLWSFLNAFEYYFCFVLFYFTCLKSIDYFIHFLVLKFNWKPPNLTYLVNFFEKIVERKKKLAILSINSTNQKTPDTYWMDTVLWHVLAGLGATVINI